MVYDQGVRKSPSIYIEVLETMTQELAEASFYSLPKKQLARDLVTLRRRFEQEGFGFLTKTLPKLAELLVVSFQSGRFALDPDLGFPAQKDWKTPAFLQCFFTRIFDEAGLIRAHANATDVYNLLQILSFYKKIERPVGSWCNPHVEAFVARATEPRPFCRHSDLRFHAAQAALATVLDGVDVRNIRGKHGPGVTSDRLTQAEKWDNLTWPEEADHWWPQREYFCPQLTTPSCLEGRTRRGTQRSRVILVPKTSKAPRLIAAEPAGLQYLQGGVAEILQRTVENHWLTAQHVNFADQEINQRLAREGSVSGHWSTIDLSDASDTVGLELVRELFPTHVGVALDLLRCQEITLEKGRTVSPTFFATMGSGLTFPVESLAFWSISVGAILGCDRFGSLGASITDHFLSVRGARIPDRHRIDYARASRLVYVYGDDIVVATDYASEVLQALQDFGFKPNLKKTFTAGPFRESCGGDYFKGTNVRPLQIKSYLPETWNDTSRVVSTLSLANRLAESGLPDTARVLHTRLPPFPVSDAPAASCLTQRIKTVPKVFKTRWNRKLHRREVWAPRVSTPRSPNTTSEVGKYLAALTNREVFQSPFRRRVDAPTTLIRWRWSVLA